LCGRFLARSSDLGIAFLLHVPSSVIQGLELSRHFCLVPKNYLLEPTVWRTWRLSHGEYKNTSSPLPLNHIRKLPSPWIRQLPSQNYISHHVGGYSLMCMQNVPQWEPGDVIPGFCAPNFNKTCKRIHCWPEPQCDLMNSLPVNKEFTSLWSDKCTDTHRL
jgi:hypothetical protein